DISSIEAGHLALELGEYGLKKLVGDAFEMLSPFAREKRLEMRGGGATDALGGCGRGRALQGFGNLRGNAVEVAPEGGSITLRGDTLSGMARFEVEDTGPGIAPAVMRNLFDRYWQAKETAKKGRGLGLFICKGLIEAQGGKIWAESLSRGAAFFFTLPLAPPVSEDRPSPLRELRVPAASTGRLVLVVDDDPDVREMVTVALRERGYEVIAVGSGTKALAYLEQGTQPRLILLDLLMADMDGWTFLAQRNRDPLLSRVPVIVLSAQPDVAKRVA